MRKIALFVLSALPLFAGFFPPTVHTSVSTSNGTDIKLSKPFPVNGMSGVVIHNYGNDLEAITGYIVQVSSDGNGKLVAKEIIHHEELPTIKTQIFSGDKVIGGYLYDNVLLLAPDADTYARVTKETHKKWIHPDLFALFLSQEGDAFPTKENLAKFAKEYQAGLIYIIKRDSAVLFDPISGQTVSRKNINNTPQKAQFPFFMRFDEIKTGWFSKSGQGNYYQVMEQF
ncbi:plasminogen-binding N-terminal domain-containing protein [Sulfurovum sp. ST-21]|uniref:Plasminogen-binding N-terminal domain-containing protein n=1 Tax=Sulfurovum indicum TaxID=2779528 RepID=A0A7M1S461_9BACT|nr:plasminogen-binding N-terminal domain-containing protein [Sulfurovum indicum]QOR62217.1 plasminogen-binding N-terminal domain-containing protein [Sulfurovum indicum]